MTRAEIEHRRGLNQAMIHMSRLPLSARLEPRCLLRAVRSALRMSQAQLARRAGIGQGHIMKIETGKLDPRLSTLRRLYDAMFCDLLVAPLPRKRPTEALAEGRVERPDRERPWD